MTHSIQTDTQTYRAQIDLNDTWEFALDPDDIGRDEGWAQPDADWRTDTENVTVPHAWQEIDEYRDYTGVAWYRRTFDVSAGDLDNRLAAVRFGAVDYEATVWLNGTRLGNHRGGYLPFEFDATDAVVEGTNELVVRVEDPEDISEIPHGKQGAPWYTRVSGIWGDVELRSRPTTHTASARVTPNLDNDTAAVDLQIRAGDDALADLTAVVTAQLDGETVTEESVSLADRSSVVLDIDEPTYWTPEDPRLYDLVVELRDSAGESIDRYEEYFGMRSFETTDDRFLLNGEPFTIRGALDQGYYPETLYRPFDDDLFEREIRLAKELGFNLLRKHIKPAHPDFIEAADRLGILVWEEPANPSVYTERSKREVRAQLKGLIDRDYNSPSVVIWSLYNEEWGIGGHPDEENLWTDEEKQAYLAELYETAREWDSTRPICDNSGWAHVATDINDYHRYFVSPDRADAWTDDLDHILAHPADNYGATETDPTTTPIVLSEFGTWGLCDLDTLREHSDGNPHWFDHDFFDDPIKRPAGVDDRFAASTLSDVFEGYDDLAATWQEREFVSVKDVIGQMRAREGIAGYVITEFSDIEWEFNGILDYYREKKTFHDDFAAVNGPVMVRLEPHVRAAWAGDELAVDVVVVNDTTERIATDLRWELFGESGSVPVEVDAASTIRLDEVISITAPQNDDVTARELTASLETTNGQARSTERMWVVDRDATEQEDVSVFVRETMASELAANGVTVEHELTGDVDIAVVTELDEDVLAFAENGGAVLQLPHFDGSMSDSGPFDFRTLSTTESWNLVSSLFYSDSKVLDGLTTDRRLGWAFGEFYPYAVVTGRIETDDVHVGSVEGWLANEASPLVTREHGAGTITACTFRLTGLHGTHPTGTMLIDNILEYIADQE